MRVLEVGAAKCWGAQHVIAARLRRTSARTSSPTPRSGSAAAPSTRSASARSCACRRTARACRSHTASFDVAYGVATLHHALDLGAMVAGDGSRDAAGRSGAGAERRHARGLALGDAPDQAEELSYGINEHVHTLYAYLWSFARAGLVVRRVEQAEGYDGARGPADRRAPAADPARRPQRGDMVHADCYGYQGASLVARKAGPPAVRIAVCRPQVPFAHGGAEIFTDTLVEELRARGHEADIVSVPFKWYPGARVLTQAFLWRLLDLTETDGRPIDMVVATKFPSYVVRHPKSASGSCISSARPTSSTAPSSGSSRESAEDRAMRRQGAGARPCLARRGDAALRDLGQRRRPAGALDGPRRGGVAASRRRRSPTATRGPGDFVLSVEPARPREADRPAARGGRAGAVAPGGRCGRRAGSRAARGDRARARPRRPGPLRGPCHGATSSPSCTRVRWRSTTRRSTRTSAWGRTSRSSPAKPVIRRPTRAGRSTWSTTGRPASSSRPKPAAIGQRRSGCASTPTRRAAFGRARQGDRRGASTLGPRRSGAAVVKVAVFSPHAARAVRDRRLLGAAAAGAARTAARSMVAKRGSKRPPRGTDLARLPRRQRPEGARLDRRRAAPHAGGRRPPRVRAPPPGPGATLAAATRKAYLDALERDGGLVSAAARPRRDREADPAALGEPAADFPLAGEVLGPGAPA